MTLCDPVPGSVTDMQVSFAGILYRALLRICEQISTSRFSVLKRIYSNEGALAISISFFFFGTFVY